MSSTKIYFDPDKGTITTIQYINVFINNYSNLKKVTFTIQVDSDVAEIEKVITDPALQGSVQFTKSAKQIFVSIDFDRIKNIDSQAHLKILSLAILPQQKGLMKLTIPYESISALSKTTKKVYVSGKKATFNINGDQIFHETITQKPTTTTIVSITPTHYAVINTPTPKVSTRKKKSPISGTLIILNFLIISVIILLVLLAQKIMTNKTKPKNNLLNETNDEQKNQSQSNT